MRGVLVLVGMAACYRPAPDRCEVTTGNPTCADAAPADAEDAAQQPVCTIPMIAASERDLVGGEWFAARLDADRFAIISVRTPDANSILRGSILGTEQDVVNGTPPFPTLFQGDQFDEYQSPRLSYDGLELFVRDDQNNVHEIVHSTRTPNTPDWDPLVALTFTDAAGSVVVIKDGTDLSPPTLTTPRRILLVYGGANGFEEYVEDTSKQQWNLTRVHMYPLEPPFGGQAQLTSDGLQLVYISSGQIYVAVRPTIDSEFRTPAMLVTTSLAAARPFVPADCKHLFYDNGAGVVRMVSY